MIIGMSDLFFIFLSSIFLVCFSFDEERGNTSLLDHLRPLGGLPSQSPTTLNGFPLQALVDGSDANHDVDDTGQDRPGAEDRRDQVELKQSDQTPIESADYQQRGG
jgi:hypothetical protein